MKEYICSLICITWNPPTWHLATSLLCIYFLLFVKPFLLVFLLLQYLHKSFHFLKYNFYFSSLHQQLYTHETKQIPNCRAISACTQLAISSYSYAKSRLRKFLTRVRWNLCTSFFFYPHWFNLGKIRYYLLISFSQSRSPLSLFCFLSTDNLLLNTSSSSSGNFSSSPNSHALYYLHRYCLFACSLSLSLLAGWERLKSCTYLVRARE